MIFIYTHFK